MWFAFGWGSKSKDLGQSNIEECRHCFEKVKYRLSFEREWILLWIIPFRATEYFAKCPECGHEDKISKSHYKLIKK